MKAYKKAYGLLGLLALGLAVGGCASHALDLAQMDQLAIEIKDTQNAVISDVKIVENAGEVTLSGVVSLRSPGAAVRFPVKSHVDVRVYQPEGKMVYQETVRLFPNLPWGKVSRSMLRARYFTSAVPSDKLNLTKHDKIVVIYHETPHDCTRV
ncbi:MAG: hypothetical protein KQJ78_07785 [Deltaproteobacteria bacterium]|nr:hypothetical protein [Deltaproteobacteria bacterium]MCB2186302.1 hypothetical protein [Deltaproteobacteria bacterium]